MGDESKITMGRRPASSRESPLFHKVNKATLVSNTHFSFCFFFSDVLARARAQDLVQANVNRVVKKRRKRRKTRAMMRCLMKRKDPSNEIRYCQDLPLL